MEGCIALFGLRRLIDSRSLPVMQPEDPDTNLQLADLEARGLGRGHRARMSEPRHDIVDRSLSTITCADRIRRARLGP